MDHIYMNRIDGQRRIHIEIHDNEISDLLDGLKTAPEPFAATHAFLDILRAAEETLSPAVAEGRRDRAARQATGQADTTPDPTTADDPTPLRWGLGDILWGDDDTTIVCLSGPDREPYWLELTPDGAAALRDDLARPDGPAVTGQPATQQQTEPPAATEASSSETTWSVLFLTGSGETWQEWSKGWRNIADALVSGEIVAGIATVAEVRFERVTVQRDQFNLHQLAQLDEAAQ